MKDNSPEPQTTWTVDCCCRSIDDGSLLEIANLGRSEHQIDEGLLCVPLLIWQPLMIPFWGSYQSIHAFLSDPLLKTLNLCVKKSARWSPSGEKIRGWVMDYWEKRTGPFDEDSSPSILFMPIERLRGLNFSDSLLNFSRLVEWEEVEPPYLIEII